MESTIIIKSCNLRNMLQNYNVQWAKFRTMFFIWNFKYTFIMFNKPSWTLIGYPYTPEPTFYQGPWTPCVGFRPPCGCCPWWACVWSHAGTDRSSSWPAHPPVAAGTWVASSPHPLAETWAAKSGQLKTSGHTGTTHINDHSDGPKVNQT